MTFELDNKDQCHIGAIHEAGHVVLGLVNNIKTVRFEYYADGRGLTEYLPQVIVDYRVELDLSLGGVVAEELFTGLKGNFEVNLLEEVSEMLNSTDTCCEVDYEEVWDADLDNVVLILQKQPIDASSKQIEIAIKSSLERCVTALQANWSIVENLAKGVLQNPDGKLWIEEINKIWENRLCGEIYQ